MTRNLPQALLTLALVFATGLLVGVGGSSLYYQKTQDTPAAPAAPAGPKPTATTGDSGPSRSVRDTLRNLKKYLEITDEQEAAIRGELETADKAFRGIFEKIRPEVEKTREDRAAAIVKHLTAEQAVVFKEKRPDLRRFGPPRRRGPPSREGFREWVATMDKNKDGVVAGDEIDERHRKNLLGYFDDNKDGLIDAAELKKDRPPPERPEGDWGRGRGERHDRESRGDPGDRGKPEAGDKGKRSEPCGGGQDCGATGCEA